MLLHSVGKSVLFKPLGIATINSAGLYISRRTIQFMSLFLCPYDLTNWTKTEACLAPLQFEQYVQM